MSLSAEAILRNTRKPVPRYTSYPTAPNFGPEIDVSTYQGWLRELPKNASLSLYLHIPFCDTLCWFCGCHTKITRQYAPITAYLKALKLEIDAVAELVPASARVTHLHWGGGSPTILSAADSAGLIDHIRSRFNIGRNFEFAIEVDPRGMDDERIDTLCAKGLTRVSVGVQDFDPKVQAAINRVQTYEETAKVIARFRKNGVRSLNIDAIYGLPGQGIEQLQSTIDKVVALEPDRIALFGYAHVPWMKKHQLMIQESDLPGVLERHGQAEGAARALLLAGYERVGIDHFAKPTDSLAIAAREGRLQRNFQGYTVDPADALIGLGASSIGRLPQGYVQNEPALARYERAVEADGLATVRGVALSVDDVMRGELIERLMCDLEIMPEPLTRRHGAAMADILAQLKEVLATDTDGFVESKNGGLRITEQGRPFVRVVAAKFDAYLGERVNSHSLAV